MKKMNFRQDQRGSVALWLGGGLVGIVGIGALAVDVGYLYVQETRLQATADVAVLAAAKNITIGEQAARDAAVDYATKNLPVAKYGPVLDPQDIIPGTWDAENAIFVAGGADPSAVRVTLRRAQGNGNAVGTMFGGVLGFQEMDIVVEAVASRFGGCFAAGFLAGEKVNMGQNVRLNAGSCVYGRDGVQFGQDPNVSPDAQIGALDINTITWGQGSVPPESLIEGDVRPETAYNIVSVLDSIEASLNLPPNITNVVVQDDLPATLTQGTAYVIKNAINIDQDLLLTDVIIATRENITFGQDGKIRNSAGACGGGEYAIGLYAVKNIAIGQDAVIDGAQIVAGETVTIGQDMRSLSASIEAGKDLIMGQDPNLTSCRAAMSGPDGAGLATARLVR